MSLYRQPGMLIEHSGEAIAPWQTPEWMEQMRQTLRPSAFLRQMLNQFTSGESEFIDLEWWDQCVVPEATPVLADPSLPVFFGVDASTKKDSTGIVGCTYHFELKKVVLVTHKVFSPTPQDPLDFETTIESALLDYRKRFRMLRVLYDPWQMVSCAQRCTKKNLPMMEFPQSLPNLTEASQTLYDLIKGRNLLTYPDAQLRLAISHAVAKEGSRGWRIGKEKQSHRIDLVVALGMAAYAAMRAGYTPRPRRPSAW